MVGKIPVSGQPIKPIDQSSTGQSPVKQKEQTSFQDVLTGELTRNANLKFSAHAQERLAKRNIKLSEQDFQRFYTGVNKVASKGARESVILVDDVAFVVSVKNRTVVTAVDGQNLKENVFTNIDSVVIM
jgi:flagellar operon protein